MASLKDTILAADDLTFEDADVPEWGVKVRVRGMSGAERDAFEAESFKLRNQGKDVDLHLQNYRARMLVRCLFDPETGERIFSDRDAGMLGKKSGRTLEHLYVVATQLSGMREESEEEATENLEGDPSGDSISG